MLLRKDNLHCKCKIYRCSSPYWKQFATGCCY